MNEAILDAVNGWAGRSDLLDGLGRFAANDLIFLLGAVLLTLGVLEWRRSRGRSVLVAIAAVVAVMSALGLVLVLGAAWYEPRPFVTDSDTFRLISHAADNSFPSDHAAVAAAAATIGGLAWPRARALLGLCVVLIAISRVFAGVHYPGDVVAGAVCGVGAGLLAWWAVHATNGRLSVLRADA